jgi:hypothetical protein
METRTDLLTDDMLARFDERAPVYDRENRFFTEDFEELRRSGYLLASVPEEFGGSGLGLDEYLRVQRRLVMLVEPFAGDRPEENHNSLGRAFYGFSTVVCTMASRAQEVGLALGAQAGESRLCEIFEQAGFATFRRATETPMNIVYQAFDSPESATVNSALPETTSFANRANAIVDAPIAFQDLDVVDDRT